MTRGGRAGHRKRGGGRRPARLTACASLNRNVSQRAKPWAKHKKRIVSAVSGTRATVRVLDPPPPTRWPCDEAFGGAGGGARLRHPGGRWLLARHRNLAPRPEPLRTVPSRARSSAHRSRLAARAAALRCGSAGCIWGGDARTARDNDRTSSVWNPHHAAPIRSQYD